MAAVKAMIRDAQAVVSQRARVSPLKAPTAAGKILHGPPALRENVEVMILVVLVRARGLALGCLMEVQTANGGLPSKSQET